MVNLRTDNTMVRRKWHIRWIMMYKKDTQQHDIHKKCWNYVLPTDKQFRSCSTSGTCCVTLVTNQLVIKRTGLWLWQTEHIRGQCWHRYPVTFNQVMVCPKYFICFYYTYCNHKSLLCRSCMLEFRSLLGLYLREQIIHLQVLSKTQLLQSTCLTFKTSSTLQGPKRAAVVVIVW